MEITYFKLKLILNNMEIFDILTPILISLIAIYEVLSRVIPTSNGWSILGNLLKILLRISDALDNTSKKSK